MQAVAKIGCSLGKIWRDLTIAGNSIIHSFIQFSTIFSAGIPSMPIYIVNTWQGSQVGVEKMLFLQWPSDNLADMAKASPSQKRLMRNLRIFWHQIGVWLRTWKIRGHSNPNCTVCKKKVLNSTKAEWIYLYCFMINSSCAFWKQNPFFSRADHITKNQFSQHEWALLWMDQVIWWLLIS